MLIEAHKKILEILLMISLCTAEEETNELLTKVEQNSTV